MEKIKIAYGICDNYQFPCFARLVFEYNKKYYLQVQTKTGISLDTIDIANIENTIKLDEQEIIDIKKPLYCIIIDKSKYYIGKRNELKYQLNDIINKYSIFFQERFYRFTNDAWNLLDVYQTMQGFKFSESTRQYAKSQYQSMLGTMTKIYSIINTFFDKNALNTYDPMSTIAMYQYYMQTYKKVTRSLLKNTKLTKDSLLHTRVQIGLTQPKVPTQLPKIIKQQVLESDLLKKDDNTIAFCNSFEWV